MAGSGPDEEVFQISSDELQVKISNRGAEIKGVEDRQSGYQFIWGADPSIWPRSAPVLFPIVGRVAGDQISVEGKSYRLGQHGFARDKVFSCIEQTPTSISFQLIATEETLAQYPYCFWLFVTYRVFRRRISVTFDVMNRERERAIHYAIGGHPGFQLPVEDLSQYKLCFEHPEDLERYYLEGGLLSGEVHSLGRGVQELPLSSALFDRDAIIFKSLNSRSVELVMTSNPNYRIDIQFPTFSALGVWTKPGCQKFLCIEPWSGYADSVGFTGDLSAKEAINTLAAGTLATHTFEISFFPP